MQNSGELPLKGKSALIVEDDALIAINAEFNLLDAGAAVVRIANSVASAKSALDEGIPFDVALVDVCLGGWRCQPSGTNIVGAWGSCRDYDGLRGLSGSA